MKLKLRDIKRLRQKNGPVYFGDQKYKFYTKEFDEVVFAEELETEEELFRLRQNLVNITTVEKFISKLITSYKEKLLATKSFMGF